MTWKAWTKKPPNQWNFLPAFQFTIHNSLHNIVDLVATDGLAGVEGGESKELVLED
jgi:hypothetical protein